MAYPSPLDLDDPMQPKRAARPGIDGQSQPSLDRQSHAVDQIGVVTAELDGLRQRLATLPVIEQSKGLLMGRYGVDADAAFAILRRWSSQTNIKLREISELLVAAASQPDPDGSAHAALDEAIRRLDERSGRRLTV